MQQHPINESLPLFDDPTIIFDDQHSKIIFIDDILSEILSFHNNFEFLVMQCSLVSKQWLRVISERSKLSLSYQTRHKPRGEFLGNIETLQMIQEYKCVSHLDAGYKSLDLMPLLTSLDIRDHGIGNLSRICKFKQLKRLCASSNLIDSWGFKCISELAQLTDLDISCNVIEDVQCISTLKQLTILNISENDIGVEGAKYISELPKLTHLYIDRNRIDNEGAKYISKLNQLTILSISMNYIWDEGAEYISKLKKLTFLEIGENMLSNEGVKHISELIELNHLDIYYNNLDIDCVQHLYKLKQLTALEICGNRLAEDSPELINFLNQLKK